MRRRFPWWIFALWVAVHALLSIGAVFLFIDRMELIDQTRMSEVCNQYLKFHPSAQISSEWAFALRCWDTRSALQFSILALIAIVILLSPVTFALISANRRQKREAG
jgi:hypothetical protein